MSSEAHDPPFRDEGPAELVPLLLVVGEFPRGGTPVTESPSGPPA